MNNLFDNLCRILATPMPRSRALKLIGGGLIGAVIAPVAFGQRKCKTGETPCDGGCCAPGQTCYGTATQICCGGGSVGATCSNGGKKGANVVCVKLDASGNYPSNCVALT